MAVLDVIYISNYECGSHLAFACCATEQSPETKHKDGFGMAVKFDVSERSNTGWQLHPKSHLGYNQSNLESNMLELSGPQKFKELTECGTTI